MQYTMVGKRQRSSFIDGPKLCVPSRGIRQGQRWSGGAAPWNLRVGLFLTQCVIWVNKDANNPYINVTIIIPQGRFNPFSQILMLV